MGRRTVRGLILAFTAGILLGVTQPALADAAASSPDLIRILRPGHGEGIHAPGARIKLKVKRGAGVNATINGRRVTSKLRLRVVRRQAGTKILRGTVPRSLVKGPPTALRFTARSKRLRSSAQVLVRAVRNRPGFLSLKLRRGGPKKPAVAVLRTRTHRIYLRAELNGRSIEGVSEATRLGVRRLVLTATEGMRRGRNVLVVKANDSRGRGTVKRRVFRIQRSLIPGVRGPGRVRSGATVRLDAGPSKGGPNLHFRYRWRFTSRPRGSKAKIRGARHRIGHFRPDVPGHYAVRLTVRRRGSAKKRTAAAGRRTAPGNRAGALTVGVDAQLPVDPYGLELHADSSEVVVGETKVPMPSAEGSMLVVPIDESTGVVGKPQTIPPRSPDGERDAQALTAAIKARAPDQLLVVAGPEGLPDTSFTVGTSTWPSVHFAAAISALGFDESDELQTRIAGGGVFALAGSPGNARGAGVSTAFGSVLDARLRPVGVSNELTGVLGIEQPAYRLFKLGGATQQMMVSGVNPADDTTTNQPLDAQLGPGDAMRVTIIDATTLQPLRNATAVDSTDQHALQSVLNEIENNADKPNSLILFKMKANGYYHNRIEMSAISKALARLGGNREMFIRSLAYGVNPPGFKSAPGAPYPGGEYVFLGGYRIQPVEGSSAPGMEKSGAPDASGVMHQDALGRWTPVASGSKDAIDQALQALAARAPVAYAYPNTVPPAKGQPLVPGTDGQYASAERQLYDVIVDGGVFCTAGRKCPDVPQVRVNYGNPDLLSTLGLAIGSLKCGGKIPVRSSATYTQAQLDALRKMICQELKSIRIVHKKLFNPLATLFSDLETDEALDLFDTSYKLLGYLQMKQDADLAKENKFLGISGEAGAILSELLSTAVDAAETLLAPETAGASVIAGKVLSSTLGLASSSIDLAGEVDTAGGDDKVAPEEITVGTLLPQIQYAFRQASSGMQETEALIMSDPTKVADALANIKGSDRKVGPIWNLTRGLPGKVTSDNFKMLDVLRFQQRLATLQYMLPRLITTVSKACDVGGSSDDLTTYEAWTAMREDGGGTYLFPEVSRLRSVHLGKDGAKEIGSYLFDPAIGDDAAKALQTGPVGAALAPSPFFMTQIAPTSTTDLDSFHHCGEAFHN